ncbi:MAG TPA: hypothetical protein VET82_11650 [Candidatus Eisenbacteria bacterium]|nr:hypothetical protein [Candidatus Eisenbacteria bacterium]
MSSILRHASAFARQLVLSLCLFGLLASPFGVRTYLDVQAAQRAAAAQQLSVIDRPAIVSARTSATSVRPFDQPERAALDGVRGKGAWFMIFASDWSNPDADRAWDMVDAAVKADLSHIYVRVADSRAHFYGAPALQDLLPIAHSRGVRVIGWIEPELADAPSDAVDAIAAARYQSAGQHLDGLALTIEQNWDDSSIEWYLGGIRRGIDGAVGLGDHYLLVASTFPVPSEHRSFPWAAMSRYCQVFAPMAYWRATGQRQFVGDGGVRAFLDQIFAEFRDPGINPYQRPVTITAQAYDAALEYGIPGSPPGDEIVASMDETRAQGGLSWSFYRLANADNGVTGDEAAAITAYPFWQRPAPATIAQKALIAIADQPAAY